MSTHVVINSILMQAFVIHVKPHVLHAQGQQLLNATPALIPTSYSLESAKTAQTLQTTISLNLTVSAGTSVELETDSRQLMLAGSEDTMPVMMVT